MDDLKISNVCPKVVTDVLDLLQKEYGEMSPLNITRGKKHNYLGMNLDFTKTGKVTVSMKKYIYNMLEEFPVEMDVEDITPSANYLFTVYTEGAKLNEELSQLFHFNVSRLLLL